MGRILRRALRRNPPAPFPKRVDAELNKVNVYTCRSCKRQLITIDRHVGVTPFMMLCDPARTPGGCGSEMYSAFYRVDPLWALRATHEWYMPIESDRLKISAVRGMLEHVMQGGLDLRPIKRSE